MPNRKNVPAFSSYLYRYRNLVERFFNKIKHYRAVATRYNKTPETRRSKARFTQNLDAL